MTDVARIPRRRDLSYEDFVREYLFPLTPVIVEDAMKWRAVERWSPEFFKATFPTRRLVVQKEEMTVARFVDQVVNADDDHPAPYFTGSGLGRYLTDVFPELAEDIQPIPPYLFPNWLEDRYWAPILGRRLNRGPKAELFFGGKGAGFPYLHWDALHFHAFNFQVYGEKHWTMFAPDQTAYLYPTKKQVNKSAIGDVLNPDLDRYPLFAQATCQQETLGPGEMLFIPAGWWHTTRVPGPSISVAVDSANASNWDALRMDLVTQAQQKSRLLAHAVDCYLRTVATQKLRRDKRQAERQDRDVSITS